jgi:hypothetical protein
LIAALPGVLYRLVGITIEWPGDLTLDELRTETVAVTGTTSGCARRSGSRASIDLNAGRVPSLATDLNGHQGANSVEEGAEIIVRMASIGAHGPSGGFFDQADPVVW